MPRAAQRVVGQLSSALKHSVTPKLHFLVLINDFPGAISKRLEKRPLHLSNAYNNLAIRAGGKLIGLSLPFPNEQVRSIEERLPLLIRTLFRFVWGYCANRRAAL